MRARPNPAPASRAGERPVRERLAARRRRRRLVLASASLSIACVFVFGIAVASYHPRLSVSEVRVEGVRELPPTLVRAAVEGVLEDGKRHLFSRENIFLYPRAEIESRIAADFPRVRTVSVSRDALLAQVVRVTIEERKPFAVWCGAGEGAPCAYMDSGGFLFAESPGPLPGRLVFRGGLDESRPAVGQTLLPARFAKMVGLVRALGEGGLHPLGLTIESEEDFSVPFSEGFALKASCDEEPEWIAKSVALLLSSEDLRSRVGDIEYIDLRFGNKTYYKLKGE